MSEEIKDVTEEVTGQGVQLVFTRKRPIMTKIRLRG